MQSIILHNFPAKLDKTIHLPASKSISNRLLMLEFLSGIDFELENLSDADDTRLLKSLLFQLRENKENTFYCKNAGTTLRFLLSALSITPGNWILTGDENMQKRPIKDLADSLKQLGADIQYLSNEGFPPLSINGKKLEGKNIRIHANLSSQFVSSLMLIAPFLKNGLQITLDGIISSIPYIEMTKAILSSCSTNVEWKDNIISIHPSKITKPDSPKIENDWSAASYFYAATALAKDYSFFLEGLNPDSLQGDGQALPGLFEKFGVYSEFFPDGVRISKKENVSLNYFEYDFSHIPDLAQTFAVCCAGLGINATLKGLASLRIKETDRLNALHKELQKMNVQTFINGDSLEIKASGLTIHHAVETYDDHRMAMAFAPLACRFPQIEILNPSVVNKSFPQFWEEFLF